MLNLIASNFKSCIPGIRDLVIVLICLIFIPSPADAQKKSRQASAVNDKSVKSEAASGGNVSLENARVLLLTEDINSSVIIYSQLLTKDSLNVILNSEYAYALALSGLYDAALVRLDRIWSLKPENAESHFYAAQVFALKGSDKLAGEFWNESSGIKGPIWIASKAPELLMKYKYKGPRDSIGSDQVVESFNRANRLTAQQSYLLSLSIFEEITNQYPGEYLPFVGYSIALERAGLYDRSAQSIENAITIAKNDTAKREAIVLLNKRLVSVKEKSAAKGQNIKPGVQIPPDSFKKRMMVYVGGNISSSYASLNTRYGYFLSESGNLAVDLGVTATSGKALGNVGFSYYQRHKIFVAGFGLNGNFGSATSAIYAKISVGLSFMNKARTSSWDLFWDGQKPFSKTLATTLGFSVGRSVYFGKRK